MRTKEILKNIFFSPFIFLIIELIIINKMWGIEIINEFTTLEQVGLILLTFFIPAIISYILLGLIFKKNDRKKREKTK